MKKKHLTCPINNIWAVYDEEQENGEMKLQCFKIICAVRSAENEDVEIDADWKLMELWNNSIEAPDIGNLKGYFPFPLVDGKPATEAEWIEDQKRNFIERFKLA